jgi:acetyl-CoA carboxylase alpha subunit
LTQQLAELDGQSIEALVAQRARRYRAIGEFSTSA